ncbi:uncharacterized protein PODANS_1_5810 [Podospora anserina S mat+]|uniref:Podospora anserina S mat+ genomic DNA chromosome 1, supercontig 1 n=1 Tax=Podospora anserina (strain S / ATCC MYA-4624 / DSM 980 / FGSC 10383) TaxID=515849 RepID=B2AB11_PODAN|nr:uncharacterized protein PODANS_1_5810 [Podospora anserina S mat+]CAP60273.1 unnamed protein product [Podospora anserina S mat+]CDP22912.1 Putative serine protease [Podospora anserina S mat+]
MSSHSPSNPNTQKSLANEYSVQFHDGPDLSHEQFLAHTVGIHATAQKFSTAANQYAGVIRHFNIGSGFRAFHGHLDPEHVEQLKQLDFVRQLAHFQPSRALLKQQQQQQQQQQIKRVEPNAQVTTQANTIFNLLAPTNSKRDSNTNEPPPKAPHFNLKTNVQPAQNWGQSRLSHFQPNQDSSPPPPPSNSTKSKVCFGPNFTVPPDHPDRFNSAGNDNNLTEHLSPALCPDAITVAATDQNGTRAGFSSYGKGVDIFAPGVDVMSAGFGDNHASAVMSGTSMAALHVARLAAYFMMVYGAHTPEEVRQRLMDAALTHVVKDKGEGSADALAYNGIDYSGGGGDW